MIENMTMLKEDEKKMMNDLTINSKTNDVDGNENPDDLVVVARLESKKKPLIIFVNYNYN